MDMSAYNQGVEDGVALERQRISGLLQKRLNYSEEQVDALLAKEIEIPRLKSGVVDYEAMSDEDFRSYVLSDHIREIMQDMESMSFAKVKRLYEKLFGFKPVTTKTRSIVEGDIYDYYYTWHRAGVLLGSE